mmetsp:Transcript_20951/g.20033  ORF Transcript_20951/g.20033 Transcript_20951/m.20033 type:complete len:99 (+) Transcript_20951:771-1067(+)
MNGKGVYAWADGRKYDGFYNDDLKEGYGVYTWPDGRKYDGYWLAGKQHGEGRFTNGKGKSRLGLWENGQKIRWIDNNANQNNTSSRKGVLTTMESAND